jgi:hypothetical protein
MAYYQGVIIDPKGDEIQIKFPIKTSRHKAYEQLIRMLAGISRDKPGSAVWTVKLYQIKQQLEAEHGSKISASGNGAGALTKKR